MLYTLWDFESSNLVAECGSEAEALGLVMDGIHEHGSHVTDGLSLQVENDQGEISTIAWGQQLADLAHRAFDPVRNAG